MNCLNLKRFISQNRTLPRQEAQDRLLSFKLAGSQICYGCDLLNNPSTKFNVLISSSSRGYIEIILSIGPFILVLDPKYRSWSFKLYLACFQEISHHIRPPQPVAGNFLEILKAEQCAS